MLYILKTTNNKYQRPNKDYSFANLLLAMQNLCKKKRKAVHRKTRFWGNSWSVFTLIKGTKKNIIDRDNPQPVARPC